MFFLYFIKTGAFTIQLHTDQACVNSFPLNVDLFSVSDIKHFGKDTPFNAQFAIQTAVVDYIGIGDTL